MLPVILDWPFLSSMLKISLNSPMNMGLWMHDFASLRSSYITPFLSPYYCHHIQHICNTPIAFLIVPHQLQYAFFFCKHFSFQNHFYFMLLLIHNYHSQFSWHLPNQINLPPQILHFPKWWLFSLIYTNPLNITLYFVISFLMVLHSFHLQDLLSSMINIFIWVRTPYDFNKRVMLCSSEFTNKQFSSPVLRLNCCPRFHDLTHSASRFSFSRLRLIVLLFPFFRVLGFLSLFFDGVLPRAGLWWPGGLLVLYFHSSLIFIIDRWNWPAVYDLIFEVADFN